jgi:hypothetical protein
MDLVSCPASIISQPRLARTLAARLFLQSLLDERITTMLPEPCGFHSIHFHHPHLMADVTGDK